MSDEKIDHAALAGKLRRYVHSLEEVEEYEVEAWRDGTNLTTLELTEAADALEAAQQAPAVDRMKLQVALVGDMSAVRAVRVTDALIASGVLQDAAEVEARGLDTVAAIIENPRPGKGDTLKRADVVAALRNRADQRRKGLPLDPEFRAQQVREGN